MHKNEDIPGEAKAFKQAVHTVGNNTDTNKECQLTRRSSWGCTRRAGCIKSKVSKVQFRGSDAEHINYLYKDTRKSLCP